MNKTKEQLQSEIRYAIRLCERTARFYRKIQSVGTFFSVIGGSAAIASITPSLPYWVPLSGGILLAVSGAILLVIRPSDKAASNDYDVKRYCALMAKSHDMDIDKLLIAIDEAHQGDAPEIEVLRNVVYNDVVLENNRPDCLVKLNLLEKMFDCIA